MKKQITVLLAMTLCAATILSGCGASRAGETYQPSGYYPTAPKTEADYNSNFNTEEYGTITESSFQAVAANPLSTFAADVDTASYANIRRMLNSRQMPQPDAVRIEEMLNYFSYDYPRPGKGEPFSVTTEISDCPWNEDTKLLLIGLQADDIDMDEAPSSNLVFLIDVSGSMDSEDKLPLVKRAFQLLTEQLSENDRVSVVTYAGADHVILSGASGEDKDDIMEAIEDLAAGGSTAGSKGIKTAYKLAREYYIDGGNNRVILATDGDLNVGVTSEGALSRLIKDEKESGVFLSVLGFGTGNIKDNKMQTLADDGDGNYSYIDSVAEARKVLVSELGGTCFTVAKDVKLQVEFNPAYMKGYRLIGYENRIMDAEDFNDDSKDGGEIGAGHRVTALYELVPVDSAMEIGSDLKYQQTVPTGSDELLTVSIRYKEPDANRSELLEYPVTDDDVSFKMSENMRFAASVAEFGMLLRQSEYRGTSSYRSVLELLSGCEDVEYDGCKEELVELVEQAAKLSD